MKFTLIKKNNNKKKNSAWNRVSTLLSLLLLYSHELLGACP